MSRRASFSDARSLGSCCFALTMLVCAFFSGDAVCTVLMLFAAAIHELGHILAARLLGIGIKRLRIDLIGASLVTDGCHSYGDEAFLCAAGPLFNLCAYLLASPLTLLLCRGADGSPFLHYAEYFCEINLCLMAVNLLPVKNFDGGRILYAALSRYAGLRAAELLTGALTLAFICLLWILSVYAVIKYQSALSLFVFSAMLFVRLLLKEGY